MCQEGKGLNLSPSLSSGFHDRFLARTCLRAEAEGRGEEPIDATAPAIRRGPSRERLASSYFMLPLASMVMPLGP